MNIEGFRSYCLSRKGVTEEFPFDEHTLVFKVMGKMFALTDMEAFDSVNLKVEPEEGVALRDQYEFVQPAYHMNKRHWVTVLIGTGVREKMLRAMIDRSYDLVVSGLTKSMKSRLGRL